MSLIILIFINNIEY